MKTRIFIIESTPAIHKLRLVTLSQCYLRRKFLFLRLIQSKYCKIDNSHFYFLWHFHKNWYSLEVSDFCCFHFLPVEAAYYFYFFYFAFSPALSFWLETKTRKKGKHHSHKICAPLTFCDMKHKFVKFWVIDRDGDFMCFFTPGTRIEKGSKL